MLTANLAMASPNLTSMDSSSLTANTNKVHLSRDPRNGHRIAVPSDRSLADVNATPTSVATNLTSAPPTSAPSAQSTSHEGTARKPELYLAWDDWDFDFDGAIWPKSNEPVDPNLSLGVIIWHPAKQATRALPATFEEAEEQSLRPIPEELGNGDSVSIYFTAENSHEAFLDVRQTDTWDFIRDDPIFVVFTDEEMQNNLVSYEECISQRDRPDEPLDSEPDSNDAEMHEADWSVMDNLEQALSASGRSEPAKARTQEDILASLGVTGLPKPVSQDTVHLPSSAQESEKAEPLAEPNMPSRTTTMPQSQPQRTQSLSNTRVTAPHSAPQRPYGSISTSSLGLPPPPPPQEQDRYDPWNPSDRRQQYHSNGFNGGRGSPARSEASDGTAAGSDFGVEKAARAKDISLTPGSKFERSDSSVSRKRSHGDTDADDHGLREHDDHTKRKRRSLVDAAYGRR
ncbi:hypothetical protein E8E13_003254 [Curvularia kusanoi]|uniref:Uncharacterized protein n=1 Tax=Curvularia kusanoi TaxID=90978 RepID=A0A9P4TE10_CURKU|nr:hypothetical protein E8E13_003254 [Curvularia kusanoi]